MSAGGQRMGQAPAPGQAHGQEQGDGLVACAACQAGNRAHRGFCRECGAALAPVCRGCRFVNERGDRFCGGCGSMLGELPAAASEAAAIRSSPPPGAARPGAAARPARRDEASALLRGDAELAALLAPLHSAAPKDELPAANITQADLDKLFGGTS